MSNDSGKIQARRRFLTGMGLVATTATLASAAGAQQHDHAEMHAQHHGFTPAQHPEDAWLNEKPGSHRVFLDSSTGNGGITALNYANNLMIGHTEGYGGAESDMGIIVCFRHASTSFGYNDAMWEKYGDRFSSTTGFNNRATDQPWRHNPMMDANVRAANRGNTIQSLIERGVSYAICNKATMSMSQGIARATGQDVNEIFEELKANNIPNSRFVPAGVVAATRAQEYGYSLLYAG
ncbi:MAG: hypothetical protein RL120_03695 [Gammaproteobacteria bacterium]